MELEGTCLLFYGPKCARLFDRHGLQSFTRPVKLTGFDIFVPLMKALTNLEGATSGTNPPSLCSLERATSREGTTIADKQVVSEE
jgi:hypothetical protein